MAFSDFLDPIFRPLLGMHPLLAVGLVSLLVAFIITIIYKYTTNQDLMKRLKTEMKELQAEMKALREKPEEMMKVQKKAMESNMKYMMQSFKSTFYTFIPIILIFGWMNANFAFEPIVPGEQFQVELKFDKGTVGDVNIEVPEGVEIIGEDVQAIAEDKAIFILKGETGRYTEGNALKFLFAEKVFFKDLIISGQEYAKKEEVIKNSDLNSIKIDYNKKIILPLINWGWLGSYIIFSIVFSSLLRKWMKVY